MFIPAKTHGPRIPFRIKSRKTGCGWREQMLSDPARLRQPAKFEERSKIHQRPSMNMVLQSKDTLVNLRYETDTAFVKGQPNGQKATHSRWGICGSSMRSNRLTWGRNEPSKCMREGIPLIQITEVAKIDQEISNASVNRCLDSKPMDPRFTTHNKSVSNVKSKGLCDAKDSVP